MADREMMERAEHVLYKTYNRYPVVFDHGKGVHLYDTEGKEYLDFGAGIAVMGLGYGDEAYTRAVKAQLDKLTHISNLFTTSPRCVRERSFSPPPGWIRCSSPTAGRRPSRGPLRLPGGIIIIRPRRPAGSRRDYRHEPLLPRTEHGGIIRNWEFPLPGSPLHP